MKYLPVILLILLSASCKNKDVMVETSKSLEGTNWQLQSIGGNTVSDESYMKGLPYLSFVDSTAINGSTGCNQFTGSLERNNDMVHFNIGAMTKMACPGNGESEFLKYIGVVDKISLESEKMILLTGEKQMMVFIPGSAERAQ